MIFVTGGTGLVGSHLLLSLVLKHGRVRALKRPASDTWQVRKLFSWYREDAAELFEQVEWCDGDILDLFSLEAWLKGVETIYHCAAVVSFESRNRARMIHNNVEGTANVVNAALACGVKRICHVSSNSALGSSRNGTPVTEATSWVPARRNTGYSESKFFSETEIWRGAEEGLQVVVVNPSIIIGPGKWGTGSTSFFPVLYKGLKFYPEGKTGFVDVRDVVDAIMLLTGEGDFERARGRKFLISAENWGYRDFFGAVADALGRPRPRLKASGWMLETAWRLAALGSLLTGRSPAMTRETAASARSVSLFDGSAITREFGFQYRPLSEAITHTANCFLREMNPSQRPAGQV
ncbi:MAG TPA: NAD-dependent epimerase/dehydratase family protein [Prolixibacteraceae bacterium]|nr:NAD-dependent epimerase/dehydratase family protein [Prolixibacteraceae bacterium]